MWEMSDVIREVHRVGVTHLEGIKGFSPLRQNKVYNLQIGEAPHFSVTMPFIYSHEGGAKISVPPYPASINVSEEVLSAVKSINYPQINKKSINSAIQKGIRELTNLEYKFMYNIFFNAQEIETIESDDPNEVKRVQQFHWNIGNYKTRILPKGFNIDFEAICKKELTALIRTPMTIEALTSPSSMNLSIVIWETVGCMFKVTEEVNKWLLPTAI